MANANIFLPFVFEGRGASEASDDRAGDRTPKRQDRPSALAGSLSPSSTKLVNPLALLDRSANILYEECTEGSGTNGDISNNYCAACKKKFTSEATLDAHLQSDKHKKAARQLKLTNSLSNTSQLPAKSPKPKSSRHPAVQGALASMKKALALANKDPAVAATVLWNIANDIAQFGDDGTTRAALAGALSCMQAMDANTELRGAKGSPTAWTARSLLKTMLECQLAQARLESRSDRPRSVFLYVDALCRYLGIESSMFDIAERDRNPQTVYLRAARLVDSIPRKFAKTEDVDQALGALEEAAAAMFAFSKSTPAESTALLWRSVFISFTAYAFALQKDQAGTAYVILQHVVTLFDAAGMGHFGCEGAAFVIDNHIRQPGSRAMVAAAVVSSLQRADLVRASCLLQKYNYRFEEPWSRFLAELTSKTESADTIWLSSDAWLSWCNVSGASMACDAHIYGLVGNAVRAILDPLTWYNPTETN
ncbi:hypothetical protein GGI02_001001 [Coemansia sp. RSA 2322]|uniref:C2H2-type domain-containing protein n=1 Tax=Coemansia thaxteri TaxID=2663907 RepID=A0A9W8BFP1_9FUNG|nr:hypothetical protein H4R26_001624 [Coemansia thaxteri]KAJ2473236.1 hypothetical protein GGI02_001001 [Coemansia sp. RSA 2322]KAJ2485699.1 hypothetical protein EV174_001567 [Coemansia sp. RSA 2320]